MKGEVIKCLHPECNWEYVEIDVASVIPENLMNAFSDPVELKKILKEQRRARLEVALIKHCQEKH